MQNLINITQYKTKSNTNYKLRLIPVKSFINQSFLLLIMTKIKENDFVELEFDIFANGKLVQTTDEKKGKENNLSVEEYGPQTIIVGKALILKALDDDILKESTLNKEKTLELTAEKAYGKRDKNLIKIFPKAVFDEHKMRAVVGVVYDFNGMYGTVKSIVGGRVMVDFNNPLAGKEIKLVYKIKSKIDDVKTKIEYVLGTIIKIPQNQFKVEAKEKTITLTMPEQLTKNKDMLIQGLEEFIGSLKDFNIKIETFKKQ